MIGAATGFQAHVWHIALLGAWAPIFGLVVIIERSRQRSRRVQMAWIPTAARPAVSVAGGPTHDRRGAWPRRATGDAWYQLTAVGCVCAAAIHTAVLPDHLAESLWYGGFFLVTALVQVVLAVLVVARPSRRLLLSIVIGSATVVVLWLVTRLVGVPIGPDNGGTEPFGVLDTLASIIEAATALCGARALVVGRARPAWRWSQWSVAARAIAPICVIGTVLASLLASRS